MVKINKIYTRTGDDGNTHLVGGTRVAKDSLRVEAYGDVDELNSWVGVVRSSIAPGTLSPLPEMLETIQQELFDLGSILATPSGATFEGMVVTSKQQIDRLETWIDRLTEGLPELRSFVLPGGTATNGWIHVARTVCRRAERRVLTLSKRETVENESLIFLNRLSDLFFAMARFESHHSATPEVLWTPAPKRKTSSPPK